MIRKWLSQLVSWCRPLGVRVPTPVPEEDLLSALSAERADLVARMTLLLPAGTSTERRWDLVLGAIRPQIHAMLARYVSRTGGIKPSILPEFLSDGPEAIVAAVIRLEREEFFFLGRPRLQVHEKKTDECLKFVAVAKLPTRPVPKRYRLQDAANERIPGVVLPFKVQ